MENQNQQTQIPQSPNQMPSVDDNSRKSILVPIGLGVIVVLVAIGAYLLGTKQNQTVVQNQQDSVVPTSIPTPTPDPTANWETYSDGYYTFKYPSDWSAKGGYEEYYKYQVVTVYNPNKNVAMEIFPTQPPYGWGGALEWKTNNLKVNFEGKEYTVAENFVDNGAYVDFKISRDKEFHILFGTGHPTHSENKSLADYNSSRDIILQILSTFQFSN